jgi:3-oxoacyl-[acyl-carrier protein] reductase
MQLTDYSNGKERTVLLEGKTALVYGGGGSIGRAMATAFAREGARLHLAGRTAGPLEAAAAAIRRAGGSVETAQLDALDAGAVDAHVDAVAERSGGVDISVAAISLGEAFGTPLVETSPEDLERPVVTALTSTLLTARAAARHMVEQRSGVILTFGGYGRPLWERTPTRCSGGARRSRTSATPRPSPRPIARAP